MGIRIKQTKFEFFTLCSYGEIDIQKIIDKQSVFFTYYFDFSIRHE